MPLGRFFFPADPQILHL